MSDLPPVTRVLLIVNILAYGLQQVFNDQMLLHFALWPLGPAHALRLDHGVLALAQFQSWQLLSYAFLHGSMAHIVFNMFALWMFGAPIERLLGTRPYAFYYGACVLGAAITQLLVIHYFSDHFMPTLGASGGIFGLLLAFGMIYPYARIVLLFPPIPMPAWLFVIGYGVLELVMGITQTQQGVAHFAHLGGMVVGIVLILYWRGKLPLKPRRILMR